MVKSPHTAKCGSSFKAEDLVSISICIFPQECLWSVGLSSVTYPPPILHHCYLSCRYHKTPDCYRKCVPTWDNFTEFLAYSCFCVLFCPAEFIVLCHCVLWLFQEALWVQSWSKFEANILSHLMVPFNDENAHWVFEMLFPYIFESIGLFLKSSFVEIPPSFMEV